MIPSRIPVLRLTWTQEIHDVRTEYPDPAALLDTGTRHTAQLWNRRASDDSWLGLRIGTGTVKSHISLETPDNLEFERVKTWDLHQFPVVVSLPEAGCLGCTGEQTVIFPTVQWMVAQMAALHSARDLSVYLLSPGSRKQSEKIGLPTFRRRLIGALLNGFPSWFPKRGRIRFVPWQRVRKT